MDGYECDDHLLVKFVNPGKPIAGGLADPVKKWALGDDVVVGKQSGPGLDQKGKEHGNYRPTAEGVMTEVMGGFAAQKGRCIAKDLRRTPNKYHKA